MRTVLFLVYYFPPMGSSGVQRPLKFIKYLPQCGWKPIVVTPESGAYHTYDHSLERDLDHPEIEVVRVAAKTMFHRADKTTRLAGRAPDFVRRLLRWFSNFLMLPDNKRGWIEPGYNAAAEIIRSRRVDAVVSTAPPYSNHIIAQKLNDRFNIPTLLDFRDDWLESHLLQYPTPLHRMRMKRLEREALQAADTVVAINRPMLQSLQTRGPEQIRYRVIPQGYDPDDFDTDIKPTLRYENRKVNLLYSGIFYNENQPDILLQAVGRLQEREPELANKLVLHFQGGLEQRHRRLVEQLNLSGLVREYGYLPHPVAVANLQQADALWLIANFKHNAEQVITGKLFEYVGAGKPILAFVYDGAARDILEDYGCSYPARPDKLDEVYNSLQMLMRDGLEGAFTPCSQAVRARYDRKRITRMLAESLEELVEQPGIDG